MNYFCTREPAGYFTNSSGAIFILLSVLFGLYLSCPRPRRLDTPPPLERVGFARMLLLRFERFSIWSARASTISLVSAKQQTELIALLLQIATSCVESSSDIRVAECMLAVLKKEIWPRVRLVPGHGHWSPIWCQMLHLLASLLPISSCLEPPAPESLVNILCRDNLVSIFQRVVQDAKSAHTLDSDSIALKTMLHNCAALMSCLTMLLIQHFEASAGHLESAAHLHAGLNEGWIRFFSEKEATGGASDWMDDSSVATIIFAAVYEKFTGLQKKNGSSQESHAGGSPYPALDNAAIELALKRILLQQLPAIPAFTYQDTGVLFLSRCMSFLLANPGTYSYMAMWVKKSNVLQVFQIDHDIEKTIGKPFLLSR
jgi:hypothetical protein